VGLGLAKMSLLKMNLLGRSQPMLRLAAQRGMAKKSSGKSSEFPEKKDGKKRFEFTPILDFNIKAPEPYAYSDKEELLDYMKTMMKMRHMETAANKLYKSEQIRGFCHLYDGQEAVAVGMEAALTFDDPLITAYRNHCQELGRGAEVKAILAELTGRYPGVSKGKGGSMHMYNRKNNYYGGNGIVGAQGPLGAGLGFALKYEKKDKNCAVTIFGDGAANQGQIAEAINMSALWKLPVIFVCENNKYGMGTSTIRASAVKEFYKRETYIPGIKIDGMDVLAVREGMKFAKAHAIEEGPIFVEMDTYRYQGHSMSDPGITYRTKVEISEIRKSRDAIDRVKTKLVDEKWAELTELKEMDRAIKKDVDEAAIFAKEAEQPPPEALYHDVYVDPQPLRGTLIENGNNEGWLKQAAL